MFFNFLTPDISWKLSSLQNQKVHRELELRPFDLQLYFQENTKINYQEHI